MSNLQKRLRDLERATAPQRSGFIVVNADPDEPGVYWTGCIYGPDKGDRLTQADIDRLSEETETLIIVMHDDVGLAGDRLSPNRYL